MKLAASIVLVATSAGLARQYTVTDLGAISPTGETHASAINTSGQVAGLSQFDVQRRFNRAVRIEPSGQIVNLGLIGGRMSFGWAINDSGHVAGGSEKGAGFSIITKPFVHRNGVMVELPTLHASAEGHALAINNVGQVAGTSGRLQPFQGTDRFEAVIWTNNQIQALGTLGGGLFSHARAINNLGHAVGGSLRNNLPMHAFVFRNGVMTDLGTLGGTSSEARDINDAGQIVGWSTNVGHVRRAFLHENGVMTDLGILPSGTTSDAYALSESGIVVGTAWVVSVGPHAFIKRPGQPMQDLNALANDPTWILQYARDINAAGQIVGVGRKGGRARGFRLDPIPCYADCNADGGLTISDFSCFQTKLVAGDPYADCTQSNGLTIADFSCFQASFVAGCP